MARMPLHPRAPRVHQRTRHPSSTKAARLAAGRSPTSPRGSARTSPATQESVPVTHPAAGPPSSTTFNARVSPNARCSRRAWRRPRRSAGSSTASAIASSSHHSSRPGARLRRAPDPERPDDAKHGPKYLNTADTLLFHKGDQLYIVGDSGQGRAVLVEGPIGAIAVALATRGSRAGAAPLGTALTESQARQLADLDARPTIATDADQAGEIWPTGSHP